MGLNTAGSVVCCIRGGVDLSPIFLFRSRVYVCEAVGVVAFGGNSGRVDVFDCRLVVVEEEKFEARSFDTAFDKVGELNGFASSRKF